MIKIQNTVIREQDNFWNHCLFHPTDAVEDPWGKRILDRFAEDGSIKTIRIYTMFEDIVYLDENNALQYDFRISDLRLDYLIEKGFDLILAYGGMPDCIASRNDTKTSSAKNKTRYKGKMWNTSPPRDYALWEEICYEYTKHNIERYGIARVASWHCHCFNEPDIRAFFLNELPREAAVDRAHEYCKLYEAFEHGVRRASEQVRIGGPALAHRPEFLPPFLDFVKEKNLKLDYIALHNYGTSPTKLNEGSCPLTVTNHVIREKEYLDIIVEKGFAHKEIVYDEWGASSHGFHNVEESPELIFRETEVFSAYYVKLIHTFLRTKYPATKMLLCLSGQHEMVTDFTGFRNFFTLNFFAKPIYNAFVLASKLEKLLLEAKTDSDNLFVIPTKNERGDCAVLLSYSDETFTEAPEARTERVEFEQDITGKTVTVYCIDKTHTNPYRLFESMGSPEELSEEQILTLRKEGALKPIRQFIKRADEEIELTFTANSVFLITVGA